MRNLVPFSKNDNSLLGWFDNLERSFWQSAFPQAGQLRADVVDNGNEYVVRADLPGFAKEDIRLDVDHDMLTVSAQKDERVEDKQDNYIVRERRYGSFSRRFDVSGVRTDDIRASYENGVLTLNLPKKQPDQLPPSRQIEIQ